MKKRTTAPGTLTSMEHYRNRGQSFLKLKERMREFAREFEQAVVRAVPERLPDMQQIVGLLLANGNDGWPRVYLKGISTRMRAPHNGAGVCFDPSDWNTLDAGQLGIALQYCHEEFVSYVRTWRALPPSNRREFKKPVP